jgi:pimeloyl-ACP methyl ester carboxylesterase
VVSDAAAERLRATASGGRGAQVVSIEAAGHTVQGEAAGELASIIRDFARTLPALHP